MTNGRKTTYEERVEIVAFCMDNSKNYHLTAEKFKVSYQQLYGWANKYESTGNEALVDRRGRHKTFDELNESQNDRGCSSIKLNAIILSNYQIYGYLVI